MGVDFGRRSSAECRAKILFRGRRLMEITMNLSYIGTLISAKNQHAVINKRPLVVGLALLTTLVLGLRAYEQFYAWNNGLDAFAPEFKVYWINLLLAAAIVEGSVLAGLVAYLWKTRDRSLDLLSPLAEFTRLNYLIQWLIVFAVALYWGLSFFSEQTAVWHMTAVRDSDFTPSNIVTFYIAYPTFVILGCGAFLYARTRIPYFANGYSLAFGILIVGVFMEIPNIGFNEWGHTAWIMDEGFAGPLHWGFVFFGWMSLAVFGVVLQMLTRIHVVMGDAVNRYR